MLLAASSITVVLNTASNRAAAVQARSRAGLDSSSLRRRFSGLAPIATSRATSSNAALSGGNNLATAVLLRAYPYLAELLSHLCPIFIDSIGVTRFLARGGWRMKHTRAVPCSRCHGEGKERLTISSTDRL